VNAILSETANLQITNATAVRDLLVKLALYANKTYNIIFLPGGCVLKKE